MKRKRYFQHILQVFLLTAGCLLPGADPAKAAPVRSEISASSNRRNLPQQTASDSADTESTNTESSLLTAEIASADGSLSEYSAALTSSAESPDSDSSDLLLTADERRQLEDLLRLRIRYGEDFCYPMSIPAVADHTGRSDAALQACTVHTVRSFGLIPDCPLPAASPTIFSLEKQLSLLIGSYSGSWSVYVKNLTTGDTFTIHDTPMKSASIMKLFIMGTIYEAISDGQLQRTDEISELLSDMISASSNEAANRLLSLLGDGSYASGIYLVNDYIQRHGYSSLTHEYNGFEDEEAICDPDHFNQTSAADCGLLLERIYRRTFASRRICNEAEAMMLNQDTLYKIPRGLPDGIEAGNKTGEMDTVENDVAVVYGNLGDYILCVLSADWESKDAAIEHIQDISATVYRLFSDPDYYRGQEPDSCERLARLLAADASDTEIIDSETGTDRAPDPTETEESATETTTETETENTSSDASASLFSLPSDDPDADTDIPLLELEFPLLELN